MLLSLVSDVLGRALREGTARFAPSCHVLAKGLVKAAQPTAGDALPVAPPLYLAMRVGQVSI